MAETMKPGDVNPRSVGAIAARAEAEGRDPVEAVTAAARDVLRRLLREQPGHVPQPPAGRVPIAGAPPETDDHVHP